MSLSRPGPCFHLAVIAMWLFAACPASAQQQGRLFLSADSLTRDHVDVIHFEYGRGHFGRTVGLTGTWLYQPGDDPSYADPGFDDRHWVSARTWFSIFAESEDGLPAGVPGVGWYRLHLRIDSTLAKEPLAFAIYRGAATETYLDGRLIHETGRIGHSPDDEIPQWSYTYAPVTLRPETTHVLAIRRSNYSSAPILKDGETAGFFPLLGNRSEMQTAHAEFLRRVTFHQMLLTGTIAALAFVHLLLFTFYPAAKTHLYFSILSVSVAAVIYGEMHIHVSESASEDLLRFRYIQDIFLVSVLALHQFAYAVVDGKAPRYTYVFAAVGIALGVSLWFVHLRPFVFAFYLIVAADGVRVILRGVLNRKPRVWIVFLGFMISVVVVVGHILSMLEIVDPLWDFYAVPVYGYGILLLAMSMSIYLASEVGGTKMKLERASHQLEEYGRTLERKVQARTKDLRREKRKTEEQARRLQELDKVKSRFFANISHEFRTPLTLIRGPVKDALDGNYGTLNPSLAPVLQRVSNQAGRLLRLVEQLLDLSRLEQGRHSLERSEVDLVDFVKSIVGSFAPLAERRNLVLTFQPEEERMPAYLDADAMEKVVSNLISNALKFTPGGGKVLVTTGFRTESDQRWAEIVVRDTGPGVAGSDQERIFERFEQVDVSRTRRHQGVGIGLSMAKELIELHGGKLTLKSVPGFGASFFARLPMTGMEANVQTGREVTPRSDAELVPDNTLATPIKDAVGPIGTNGAAHVTDSIDHPAVLVVEDNAEVREYLRELLAPRYRIIEARNGKEGIQTARRERPDLVISDIMMPDVDGLGLLEALKDDDGLRDIPVLLLTARAEEADLVGGLDAGAQDYILKPFDPKELQARVHRMLATHRELRDRYRRELKLEPAGVIVSSDDETFCRDVVAVAEAHRSDSTFTVEIWSDELGMSRRQLTRKAKDLLGEAPSDLLRRLRMERAAQLLKAGSGTVAQVAYNVGFKSASHFTRTFKKHFGCTPSEFA